MTGHTGEPAADSARPIRIAVIKGSVRPGNYTGMAAALVVDELLRNPEVSVDIADPLALDLRRHPALAGDHPRRHRSRSGHTRVSRQLQQRHEVGD